MTIWAKMREEESGPEFAADYGRVRGPYLDRRVITFVESEGMPVEAGFVFRLATNAEWAFYQSSMTGLLVETF